MTDLLLVTTITIPFWMWFAFNTAITRVQDTIFVVDTSRNEILKKIRKKITVIPFKQLSEARILRQSDGQITHIWLAGKSKWKNAFGIHSIDEFNALLTCLKSVAPACRIKEFVIPKYYDEIRWMWVATIVAILLIIKPENHLIAISSLLLLWIAGTWPQEIKWRRSLYIITADILAIANLLLALSGRYTDPSHREVWQDLIDQKRFTEAIPYLEKETRTHAGDFRYVEPMAYVYSSVGMYPSAVQVLENLRRSQGHLTKYGTQLLLHAHVALAILDKNNEDWPGTLSEAKAAISIDPTSADAYNLAGLAAWETQGPQSEEAKNYYFRYIRLEPDAAKTKFIRQLYPDYFRTE